MSNNKENIIDAKDMIEIDGVLYEKDNVSPTVYFEYVKNMKKNIEDENLQIVADNCLTLLKKAKLTG